MAIEDTRTLLRELVTQDLLGPEALLEGAADETPPAPAGYELVRLIGRGGGGVVYLARDVSLDRQVAIKYLGDIGRADIERFRREARYTARLRCPSIVQVYELGDIDDRPYIAMQYLPGGSLADADLDAPALARVARDVAVALGHAHREGIVHRDIKPENILLDDDGHPHVADFGIARDLRGTLGETMSADGQVIGTPGLMPPEQARGDIQAVDARSDVYAVGATLYRQLTGRYPFAGASLVDVLHAVIHDDPPLPRSFDPAIPGPLEAIVMKCMRKARRERFQTTSELIDAIDRYLDGVPGRTEASPWFRRLVHQREEAPRDRDVHDRDATDHDTHWSAGIEIVRDLAAWDANLYRVSGSLERAFARLDALRGRLDAILLERPDMAWARFYRGVALFRRGHLADAQEEMERSIDRVRNLGGAFFELGRLYVALYLREHDQAHKHISALGTENGLRNARRRIDQAVVAFQEAQRLSRDLAPWHRDYAAAVGHLGDGDFDGCVAVCDQVLEHDPDLEEIWKLRGDALNLAGLDPFESYDRAIEVRRSYFEAMHAKGAAHHARGQQAEARTALARASTVHPDYAEAAALLARTYLKEAEGRPDDDGEAIRAEGCRVAQRALEIGAGYDAAVTLAELHLDRGRTRAPGPWFDAAQDALAIARGERGCQNRVALISARTHLVRARQIAADGGDPGPALEAAVGLGSDVLRQIPDDPLWKSVRAEADAIAAEHAARA